MTSTDYGPYPSETEGHFPHSNSTDAATSVEMMTEYTTEFHSASLTMDPCPTICDVPQLADVDKELRTECVAEYITMWTKNSDEFLREQQKKVLRMALCPFLFGVTDNLPQAWIDVLNNYVLPKDREHQTTPLSDEELDMLEMVEVIFNFFSQHLFNKHDLRDMMQYIFAVEEKSKERLAGRDGGIDINLALDYLSAFNIYKDMKGILRRVTDKRKKQQYHIIIIYFFKTISHHVELYGRDGVDKAEFTRKFIADRNRAERESSMGKDVTISQGNKAFKEGNYVLALELYSAAIDKDHFSSLLYSNRAQAYLALGEFKAALCDSKRAIQLDSKNSKHYFRAAKSYLELGDLEKAEELNEQSLDFCTDDAQKSAVEKQRQEICAAKMTYSRIRNGHNATKDRMAEKENELQDHKDITVEAGQYHNSLCNGHQAYQSMLYTKAVGCYETALDLINLVGTEALRVDNDDVIVLLYALGMSCVKTANYHNLQTAIDKFSQIIAKTDSFPAAYYGLGLAYKVLNRYSEAVEPLTAGLKRLDEVGESQVFLWPQSAKPIEETNISTLKKLMKDLLKECQFPPKPDAICKFHVDMDNPKREIYLTDPDYKGYVCLECRQKCSIQFHSPCWKVFKHNSIGKHVEKEMLDNQCPTPNCWGLICKIYIYKPGYEKPVEITSTAETPPHIPRPIHKIKSDIPAKLEKKAEKKRLRKERKQEAQRRKAEEMERNKREAAEQSAAKLHLSDSDDERSKQNIAREGTLLKKEPEVLVEGKQKTVKLKKKEKKTKQVLTLDVQFREEEGKERYSVFSADNDEETDSRPPININSSLLPAPGTGPYSISNGSVPVSSQPLTNTQATKDLLQFFYELLKESGPTELTGPLMQDMLESMPPEAMGIIESYGGIGGFLRSSSRFSIAPDQVVSVVTCLLATPRGLLPTPGNGLPMPGSGLPSQNPKPQPLKPPAQTFSWQKRAEEIAAKSKVSNVQEKIQEHQEQLKKEFPLNLRLNPAAKEFVPSGLKLPDDEPTADNDEKFVTVTGNRSITKSKESVLLTTNRFEVLGRSRSSSSSRQSVDTSSPTKSESNPKKTSPMDCVDGDISDEEETSARDTSHFGTTAMSASDKYPHYAMSQSTPSDTGSLGSEDAHRSASPVSSNHSLSSSAVAGSSQAGSQTSLSLPQLPKPLKAPGINLPTRGRKKGLRGRLPQKSGLLAIRRPSSADGSVTSSVANEEDGDLESLASTTSDQSSLDGQNTGTNASYEKRNTVSPESARNVNDVSHHAEDTEVTESKPAPIGERKLRMRFNSDQSFDEGRSSSSPLTGIREMFSPDDRVATPEQPPTSDWEVYANNSMYLEKTRKAELQNQACSQAGTDPEDMFVNFPHSWLPRLDEDSAELTSSFPSFHQNTAQPALRPPTESRVLKQLASRNTSTHETSISALSAAFGTSQPQNNITSASNPIRSAAGIKDSFAVTNLNDPFTTHSLSKAEHIWSAPETPKSHNSAVNQKRTEINPETTVQDMGKIYPETWFPPKPDEMDRPILSVKGPWKLAPELPATTSSPLVTSSSLAPIDSQGMAWMVSGIEDGMKRPVTTSIPLPERLGSLNPGICPTSFSRTPGKRNPFSQVNITSFASAFPGEKVVFSPSSLDDSVSAEPVRTTALNKTTVSVTSSTQTEISTRDVSCSTEETLKDMNDMAQIFKRQAKEYEETSVLLRKERQARQLSVALEAKLKEQLQQLCDENLELRQEREHFKALAQEASSSLQLWKKEASDVGEDRERLLARVAGLEEEAAGKKIIQNELEEEQNKRLENEKKILQLSTQITVKNLELHRQEGIFHVQRLGGYIRRAHQSAQPIAADLEAKLKEWADYIKQCEVMIQHVMTTLRKKIEELERGCIVEPISVTPPPIPKPPSQPDSTAASSSGMPAKEPETSKVKTEEDLDDDSKAYLEMFGKSDIKADDNNNGTVSTAAKPKPVCTNGAVGGASTAPNVGVIGGERDRDPFFKPPRLASPNSSPASVSSLANLAVSQPQPASLPKPIGSSRGQALAPLRPAVQPIRPPFPNSSTVLPRAPMRLPQPGNIPVRPVKPAGGDKMSTFEKLVMKVKEAFPGHSRDQIQQIIDDLRKTKGGSLSGLSLDDLTAAVIERILELDDDGASAGSRPNPQDLISRRTDAPKDISDSMCSICHEDVEPENLQILECRHRFHEQCIRLWFEHERSCPNCRTYVLLQEEYPSLR